MADEIEYPQRTDEHVTETAAWQLLQSKSPKLWIVREVTGRDYGIDAYSEFVGPKLQITGELCSIQLKGTATIEWKEVDGLHETTFYVPMSTVNYWTNLPVPVFLMLADTTEGRVFFAPVKSEVRKQSGKIGGQKNLGFKIRREFELGTELGDILLPGLHFRERNHEKFHTTLRELLLHWQEYLEFIQDYQGRDLHLGIECDEEMTLHHIYKASHFLARYLDVPFNVVYLGELYLEEQKLNDKYYRLHQWSVEKLCYELEPVFLDIVDACQKNVLNSKSDYWLISSPMLVQYCRYVKVQPHKADLERRRKKP